MTIDNAAKETMPEILDHENDKKIALVLKEVETNFRKTISGHIEYHRYLENEALKEGHTLRARHHAVRRTVYEQILSNYSLSQIYDKP